MNVHLNSGSVVEIQPHKVLTLAVDCASRLIAESGTLWITDTIGSDDWLLEAGQSYAASPGTTVYVEALGSGAVRLISEC